jgi:hypothetical protein
MFLEKWIRGGASCWDEQFKISQSCARGAGQNARNNERERDMGPTMCTTRR